MGNWFIRGFLLGPSTPLLGLFYTSRLACSRLVFQIRDLAGDEQAAVDRQAFSKGAPIRAAVLTHPASCRPTPSIGSPRSSPRPERPVGWRPRFSPVRLFPGWERISSNTNSSPSSAVLSAASARPGQPAPTAIRQANWYDRPELIKEAFSLARSRSAPCSGFRSMHL